MVAKNGSTETIYSIHNSAIRIVKRFLLSIAVAYTFVLRFDFNYDKVVGKKIVRL